MRSLLVFLSCFLPSAAFLAYLGRDDPGSARLPDEAPPATAPALLETRDLADPYGQAPFSGVVRRLDGFEIRVVEEGYFKLYLRIGRLGRHDGRPRLEEVRGAVFDPPIDGRPNLRLTLRAPFVTGDPRELIHAPSAAPRVLTLGGGVEVHDAAGRPLAAFEALDVDITTRTIESAAPVILRLPDRDAEVRAPGLFADLQLREARLPGPVAATFAHAAGSVSLRAGGGATVAESADGAATTINIDGGVRLEHASGRVRCDLLTAELERGEGGTSFRRAVLSGAVRLEAAPGTAGGLEWIEMTSLAFEGEDRVACEGPVLAGWRGPLEGLALGERTIEIRADSATLSPGRSDGDRLAIDEARFLGFSAGDLHGAGTFAARSVVYHAAEGTLAAEGASASTPTGDLVAERLLVTAPGRDAYDILLEGEKRVAYRAEGRLGPLGRAAGGLCTVTSRGPLRVRALGPRIEFEGEDGFVAETEGGARLEAARVSLVAEGGEAKGFEAIGDVRLLEPQRGAEIRGNRLSYAGGAAVVEGTPASVSLADGRRVAAASITYGPDRSFSARGGVEVVAPLSRDGEAGSAWSIRCDEASGALSEDGRPLRIAATGAITAAGPTGESLSGARLAYDAERGEATLEGAPARVDRGDEVAMVAPKGLVIRIAEGRVVEGRSLGPASIDYRPRAPAGEEARGPVPGAGFGRWHIELKGPARFEGEKVVVPAGARLHAYDAGQGQERVTADAGRVELLVAVEKGAVSVTEIRGSRGVRVEGKGKRPLTVTARELSYRARTSEVRIAGDAAVEAEGWPREARFREVVFSLTAEGIDLKRASEIEVR